MARMCRENTYSSEECPQNGHPDPAELLGDIAILSPSIVGRDPLHAFVLDECNTISMQHDVGTSVLRFRRVSRPLKAFSRRRH